MIKALTRIVSNGLANGLNFKFYNNLIFKHNLSTISAELNTTKSLTSAISNPYGLYNVLSSFKLYNNMNNNINHIFNQKCFFAGRQRGLKRRKYKKESRRIQVSLGRRLELFYPKKAKQVRIRLVQNSRGNLIYDPVLKKFYVFYYKQGTQVFRSFRASGSKFEIAKAKAVNFARQMGEFYKKKLDQIQNKYDRYYLDDLKGDCETINYNLKLQPDCSLSGVRNIFFDSKRASWVVCYNEHGVRKYRFFDTNELGFQTAYTQAVDHLRFQLFRSHRFLHRRHRTRKNRPILIC